MFTLLKALVVAIVGLALGLWATEVALDGRVPIAVAALGGWRLEARAGAADADPYARARVARSGEIPLALGEGLRLTTFVDNSGRALDPACVYKLGPRAPAARYWTLEAIDAEGFPVVNVADRYAMRSTEILREPDGGFWVWIARQAHSGNWLAVGGRGGFGLALRLYDPALGDASVGFESAVAPDVVRQRCG